jgi:hypothetical protein
MSTHLTTYLNDHLAGSVAAVDLVDRLIKNDDMADARDTLVRVRADISADQEMLSDLLKRAGGEESALRHLGGWLADKASRLKLLLDDPVSGRFERLEAFEILALGILGKRSLWHALSAAQPQIAGLRGVDFPRLVTRADEQYTKIEALRLDAARRALSDS